jgi:ABC-type sugar transport system ATPase subunit
MDVSAVVSLDHVSKRFGPTLALDEVSLDLLPGEIHVLLGENGAGKSTLVKTLLGTYHPDRGRVFIRGREVSHHNPALARREGINVVLQDFSLAPTMTVLDNLFLGRQPLHRRLIDTAGMRAAGERTRELVGGRFSLQAEVGALPRSEQQLVEIMKAVMGKPGALLLDEPTAALSELESERLFGIVDRLAAQGWAILYITHRMAEIRRLGTRVTVMRDGRHVATHRVSEVSDDELVREMVGRDIKAVYPDKADPGRIGETVLRLTDVSSANGKVRNVSLQVRRGEIVGVAGLVGGGKGDVARVLSGLEALASGEVQALGYTTGRPTPRKMIAAGVGFMPEDRKRESLALPLSTADNINLEAVSSGRGRLGFLQLGALKKVASDLIRRLDIRPTDPHQEVGLLSGGNQQKVVLARALTRPRDVFIVAEPTAGVDVGSRQQIYAEMRRLCNDGAGVLVVSSDLEEVVGISDRVYVMNAGTVQAELVGDRITDAEVVAAAFGHGRDDRTRSVEEAV